MPLMLKQHHHSGRHDLLLCSSMQALVPPSHHKHPAAARAACDCTLCALAYCHQSLHATQLSGTGARCLQMSSADWLHPLAASLLQLVLHAKPSSHMPGCLSCQRQRLVPEPADLARQNAAACFTRHNLCAGVSLATRSSLLCCWLGRCSKHDRRLHVRASSTAGSRGSSSWLRRHFRHRLAAARWHTITPGAAPQDAGAGMVEWQHGGSQAKYLAGSHNARHMDGSVSCLSRGSLQGR
jgi:hypothetical protein